MRYKFQLYMPVNLLTKYTMMIKLLDTLNVSYLPILQESIHDLYPCSCTKMYALLNIL